MKFLKLRPEVNKANGQIRACFQKKKLDKKVLAALLKGKELKVRIEGFD